jgi:hypothetical protein
MIALALTIFAIGRRSFSSAILSPVWQIRSREMS